VFADLLFRDGDLRELAEAVDAAPVPVLQPGQLRAAGGQRGKGVVLGRAIKASDALVLAEVQSENGGSGRRVCGRYGKLLGDSG
jgi:hypothetical protein